MECKKKLQSDMFYYDEDDGFNTYRSKQVRLLEESFVSEHCIDDNSQSWIGGGLYMFELMKDRADRYYDKIERKSKPREKRITMRDMRERYDEEREARERKDELLKSIALSEMEAEMRHLKELYRKESELDDRNEALLKHYASKYKLLQIKYIATKSP